MSDATVRLAFSPDSDDIFMFWALLNGKVDADEATSDNAYASWTPRLLQSAYNYQYVQKDPGAFVHNPKYVMQFLYDSIKDLGGDVSKLFGQFCISCHGDKVPTAPNAESALQIIALGGAHVTMPVWGDILTSEQINALTTYAWDTSQGVGVGAGEKLFASNCRGCHGKYGEGGPNPTFPGDMILPISSAEYLKTRDDATIRNVITKGQPSYGMSPFGGALSNEQIDAVVAFIRSWEANPPSTTPPQAPAAVFQPRELTAKQLYDGMCAQCHGGNFEGSASAPALDAKKLRDKYDDQALLKWASESEPWNISADAAEGKMQVYRFDLKPASGEADGPPPRPAMVGAAGPQPSHSLNVDVVLRYWRRCDRERVVLRPVWSRLTPLCDTQKSPSLL